MVCALNNAVSCMQESHSHWWVFPWLFSFWACSDSSDLSTEFSCSWQGVKCRSLFCFSVLSSWQQKAAFAVFISRTQDIRRQKNLCIISWDLWGYTIKLYELGLSWISLVSEGSFLLVPRNHNLCHATSTIVHEPQFRYAKKLWSATGSHSCYRFRAPHFIDSLVSWRSNSSA